MPRPTNLALATPAAPLAKLVDRARGYAADGRAGSTKKAYLSDFRSFEAWCSPQGVPSAPDPDSWPCTPPRWPTSAAASRPSSAPSRRSPGQLHARRSGPRSHPALTEVLRESGGAWARRRRRRRPSSTRSSSRWSTPPAASAASRSALLSLGWFGAFRRAELVSLDAGDVEGAARGLVVTLRRSKGDQEGRGARRGSRSLRSCALSPCARSPGGSRPPASPKGPIFRGIDRHGHLQGERLHPSSVARIVKRCAERAGSIRRSSRGTRSGRGSPRRPPSAASPSTRSCGRRSTARARRTQVHPAREAVRRQRGGGPVLSFALSASSRTNGASISTANAADRRVSRLRHPP